MVRISVLALFTIHHPVAVAAVLEGPAATELDASRARLFKPTHIKTQSRTGSLTGVGTRKCPSAVMELS